MDDDYTFGGIGRYGDAWSGVAIAGWSLMPMNACYVGLEDTHTHTLLLFILILSHINLHSPVLHRNKHDRTET